MNSFLNSIKDHVIAAYEDSKILPSVTAAQAILESARGTSELARNANNLFGIKGNYGGNSYSVNTKEYLNGQWTTVKAAFKKYPSYRESILDHGSFFTSTSWRTQNYKNVLNATDYKSQARALQSSGYATDPQYADKLINLIESEGLAAWDNDTKGNVKMGYKLVNNWTPSALYYIKAPYAMNPDTLTVHNTGNTASARNEAAYMNGNSNQVSYHAVGDDKEIHQLIPFNRNAWAAGDGANGPGNRRSIHFEIAYSMDNGYSGAMSERYLQAQENATLYIAHVLIQKNWGTDKLRQHYDWSRKDCPHKIRAHGYWEWFVRRVQQHMDAIKGGTSSGVSKPTTTAPKANAQKASNGKYTVKKGDTLWGIATANKTTVDALKSLNNLKSATIQPGQTLTVKNVSTSRDRSTWGWHWSGTFTVTANDGVAVYAAGPGIKAKNLVDKASFLAKGTFVNFDHLFMIDGYWWIRFKYAAKGSSTAYFFAPIGRKLTGVGFATANKRKQLWGTVTKLNAKEDKSGVTNWHKKEAVK